MDAATVTTVTSAVDFATIVTGIGTIAAAIVLVKVAAVGAQKLLAVIR